MSDDKELIARLRESQSYEWQDPIWETHDAADRIEALIEQLAAAQDDAKEAEAYAGEVEREQKGWQEAAVKLMNKLTTSEAKLAKAVEALENLADCVDLGCFCSEMQMATAMDIARATLEEIKGESHE